MSEGSDKGWDRLWAPWRAAFIKQSGPPTGCIFCDLPQEDKDRENLIVYRGRQVFVLLNRYPYNNGHLMVAPYAHTADLADLDDACQLEMMQTLRLAQAALDRAMAPHGYNTGMNLGRVAGAGIADHLHLHIVPRWSGDTNFMPVLGGTKVISESLDQSWSELKAAFEHVIKQQGRHG